MQITFDRYGTKIYTLENRTDVDNLDENEIIVIKCLEHLESQKFKHMFDFEQYHIYGNARAIREMPIPKDGIVYSSAAVVVISGEKFNYVIGIKDRHKRLVTTVRGGREDFESFQQCIIRELFEETSIQSHEIQGISLIDNTTYDRCYLDFILPGQCERYLIWVKCTNKRIQEIINYQTYEILKVHIIRVSNIFKNNHTKAINWNFNELKFIKKIIKSHKISALSSKTQLKSNLDMVLINSICVS